MKLANRSKLSVYAGVFSGDPPLSVEKRIVVTNNSGNLPSGGESVAVPPGIYWVMMNTSAVPGKLPPGILVGQTGGARDTNTAVLTQDLRITVEA
jgi:hypothetical protein